MFEKMDRREFIDRAAIGTAGAAFAAHAASAQGKPSNRVVVGVMGLSRGLSLACGFAEQPDVEVRYVCDTDTRRAEQGCAAVEKKGAPKPQIIADFRKMLDDKELDALVCAAPNHWHASATILACNAGKHVYVEKPCSHNPWEAQAMAESARKHDRVVQVGTQRRSSANVREAIGLLHSGELGRVYSSRSHLWGGRGTIGTGKPADVPAYLDYELWQGPAPRRPYKDNLIPYNWHWHWHWGNGELGNNGVHTLDLCRWGLQVDFPVRVTSSGGRYCFDDDQETPDTHVVAFEYADEKLITWQGHSCNQHVDDFVSFYGEKGMLKIGDLGDYTLYDANDKLVREVKGTLGEPEHIANFLAAVRADDPSLLNCAIEHAYPSTTMCHLGNIAHRTGRALTCDPKNGAILNDDDAMRYWKREYEPGWEPIV
ncbi:MAG: Gfo/Idh/MocA family oxidoreductase [Candidatus Hydrogenedentes bacterium]|nr:Gfo/Idh/MocA family oxidoreductase [Candidatus Hydrogenedentota bacterium]